LKNYIQKANSESQRPERRVEESRGKAGGQSKSVDHYSLGMDQGNLSTDEYDPKFFRLEDQKE